MGASVEPADDKIRTSDVSFWAIVALVCGAVAVVSSNVSALLPPDTLRTLHASRIDGATIGQINQQVAGLNAESNRLSEQASHMATRLDLAQESQTTMLQRVGSLEATVPSIIETASANGMLIDNTILTSGIGDSGPQEFTAEGGSVVVQQKPMTNASGAVLMQTNASQPRPQLLAPQTASIVPDAAQFGIAVGPVVTQANAPDAWKQMSAKMGALVLGLGPVLADTDLAGDKRLVVGPLRAMGEATDLCRRLERVSISCEPVPFVGVPL